MRELDLELPGGQVVHVYDTGPATARHTVCWHHGTPNLGTPPAPLHPVADRLGLRLFSYDRPGYGTSTPRPGRTVADAASLAAVIADALGIGEFAVLGHSGGGTHALACATLLPDRVTAAAALAPVAPLVDEAGFDWFEGMAAGGAASLRAAAAGRAAKEAYEATAEFDPDVFTPADHAALSGRHSWLQDLVRSALAEGPGALVDDDLAYVTPWDADPAALTAPVLVVHGEEDRMVPVTHGAWLATRCPNAELRRIPGAGHLSVLDHAPEALEWLAR